MYGSTIEVVVVLDESMMLSDLLGQFFSSCALGATMLIIQVTQLGILQQLHEQ
jgi:hypothetical protein